MATYVVVVEQQENQESKRDGHKYPTDIQVPKVYEPASRLGWVECGRYWHALDMRVLQVAGYVRESDPENGGELPALGHQTPLHVRRSNLPRRRSRQ